jgi:hypothetical protein
LTAYTFTNVSNNHTIQATFSQTVSFAVNSGGKPYTDSAGNAYLADSNYSGGAVNSTTASISGTSDVPLYQTERYGNFAYHIPAANGNYSVTFKFAETKWSSKGKRVFNVAIAGQTVISNLDIYALVGKNRAYDVTVPVTVTNGAIDINFISMVYYAKVDAIMVKVVQ